MIFGCLAQVALLSSSELGAVARSNALVVIVPVYGAIALGIANVLIPRRITYSVQGDKFVVARWWRRRTYSFIGGSVAFAKWSTPTQGVAGTLLLLNLRETAITIAGKDFRFEDAAHYTRSTAAPHVPVMQRDAFTSLVSAVAGATDGRARGVSAPARADHRPTTTVELSVSTGVLAVRWSFGSMLLVMVAAIAGGLFQRFVPGVPSLLGAATALLVAGTLLYRLLQVPSYRLEFSADRVALRRRTGSQLDEGALDQLSITRGRHVVGRGGGTIPTLVLRFPSGRSLRVGATGVATTEHDALPATWLFNPDHTVGALEWPILLRCLRQPNPP
ncbi:MAG TPA: hypothetical protein VK427_11920, partial [Kofleriaceae bacterium]|nr:hypothetical protein [Kofleriaceae bacterium]